MIRYELSWEKTAGLVFHGLNKKRRRKRTEGLNQEKRTKVISKVLKKIITIEISA